MKTFEILFDKKHINSLDAELKDYVRKSIINLLKLDNYNYNTSRIRGELDYFLAVKQDKDIIYSYNIYERKKRRENSFSYNIFVKRMALSKELLIEFNFTL